MFNFEGNILTEKLDESKNLTLNSQPRALYVLFIAELWERFSFYGLRALLILYMTTQLKHTDSYAYGAYGTYLALVFAANVVGGYLADRYLGSKKALYLGGYIILLGHLCLIFPFKDLFHLGLSFIVIGTGFFKVNVSSFLGEFYVKNNPRRDAGFTIFYMGVNLGTLLAPLVCGYIGEKYGWNYGFGAAGFGMLIGILTLYYGDKSFGQAGQGSYGENLHKPSFLRLSPYTWIIILSLLSAPLFSWGLRHHGLMENFLPFFGIAVLIFLVWTAIKCEREERKSMLTLILMLPFFTIFFASFEQAGGSMNLFTDRYVDRGFGGLTIPTPWFQSLNPLFIVLLAPLFSILWGYLGRKGKEPLAPVKFFLALLQMAIGFWFLKIAVEEVSMTGTSSMIWLVLAYLFHTTGEICLNPVGLSLVTKMAPVRFVSSMMGALFLSISFAHLMAQQVAKYFTAEQEIEAAVIMTHKAVSLNVFGDIFQFLIYFPLAAGLLLLIIYPFVKGVFERHR